MKICFATNNDNKLIEIRNKLGKAYDIISLSDIHHSDELAETHDTLEENSLQKAEFINQKFGIDCFADDTGLLVDALGGAPGVNSARYAGEHKSSQDNINLLLHNLKGMSNRKAKFVTVITLILNESIHQFHGEINGTISEKVSGNAGFGYDPIFVPEGWQSTFADVNMTEKNKVSHRSIAVEKLVQFLNSKA